MKLTWFGTASIGLHTNETNIVFDPFLPMNGSSIEIEGADYAPFSYILITHGHFDHILSLPQICHNTKKRIYATDGVCKNLERLGLSPKRLMSILPGAGFEIGDIHITPYAGKHIRYDKPLIRETRQRMIQKRQIPEALRILKLMMQCPERDETVGYEVKAEGKRIFVMGSLALREGAHYPKQMDYLILPYQGHSQLLQHAKKIIERLEPKAVILDHFDDTFPPISKSVDVRDILEAEIYGRNGDRIPIICPEHKEAIEL